MSEFQNEHHKYIYSIRKLNSTKLRATIFEEVTCIIDKFKEVMWMVINRDNWLLVLKGKISISYI